MAHLDDEDAGILTKNKLDGESALELAKLPQQQLKEELKSDGLSRGAAVKLAKALCSLVPVPTSGHSPHSCPQSSLPVSYRS